jgi:hypothetical protein
MLLSFFLSVCFIPHRPFRPFAVVVFSAPAFVMLPSFISPSYVLFLPALSCSPHFFFFFFLLSLFSPSPLPANERATASLPHGVYVWRCTFTNERATASLTHDLLVFNAPVFVMPFFPLFPLRMTPWSVTFFPLFFSSPLLANERATASLTYDLFTYSPV